MFRLNSYATYCEGSEGESGPVETDISACVRYLDVMLPVDDLKGASRAIAPGPSYTGGRPKQAGSAGLEGLFPDNSS